MPGAYFVNFIPFQRIHIYKLISCPHPLSLRRSADGAFSTNGVWDLVAGPEFHAGPTLFANRKRIRCAQRGHFEPRVNESSFCLCMEARAMWIYLTLNLR